MELVAVLLIGFLIRGAMEHSKGDRARSRDQRVKEVAKTFPKGALPKSRQRSAARHAAAGWWAREIRHGFPVHRTGWHAAWLAHQTVADHHKARREEARTTALETRASVLKGMPEHKQRQAEAQAELDKIEEELAAQQAKGSPATGKSAVESAADEVARKREQRVMVTDRCPSCGAYDGYDHLAGCDRTAPPLPADGVTLLTARSKSGRPVNAVTGEPEDTVAVYGKEDLDRRLAAAADDPDIEVTSRPPRTEDPDLPDASRNPQPITTTASPTTQGAPMSSAETTYRQVLQYTDDLMAGTERVAVQLGKDVTVAMQVAEDLQGAEADGATISAQMELADRVRTAEASLRAVEEQAGVVKNALQQHSGLQEAHDNAPVRAANRDFYQG